MNKVQSVAILLAEALVRRADGHVLALADDPMTRRMGFKDRTTGETVVLGLSDAKMSMGDVSKRTNELLQTPEGRRMLFEGRREASPKALLVPPVLDVKRPLVVDQLANAIALVEEHDQMVVTIEMHPQDLTELRQDPKYAEVAAQAAGSEGLGADRVWGSTLVPTVERKQGSVLLIGDKGQAGVIQVV